MKYKIIREPFDAKAGAKDLGIQPWLGSHGELIPENCRSSPIMSLNSADEQLTNPRKSNIASFFFYHDLL